MAEYVKQSEMLNVNAPPLRLLVKIGSILVHVEEEASDDGHPFDAIAMRSLLADREVQEWLDGMRKLAFLPVKRK